ncbi:MAG TPA: GyrI-like domain-containing protein [Micromonosporaceae bacterium]|nr:GyrI-like domain-containing protein [Micromonosporaceae bacterium]
MSATHDVTPRVMGAQHTAVVHARLPAGDLPGWLPGVLRAVDDYLHRVGLAPCGPAFARYTFLDGDIAVEAGYPSPAEVAGDGWVHPSTLPGGRVAVTTRHAVEDGVAEPLEAVRCWLAARGYAPAGPHWEVYFTSPEAVLDPARWRIDVVVPYAEPA